MSKIVKIALGASGGVLLGVLGFAFTLAIAKGVNYGPVTGLTMFFTSPFFMLLYIVVLFNTMIPAGLITGTAAGFCAAFIPKPWSLVVCGAVGVCCGGFSGVRFIDIIYEANDTMTDLVAGGIASAIFLGLAGVGLCRILTRK